MRVEGGQVWRVTDVVDRGGVRALTCREEVAAVPRVRAGETGSAPPAADLVVMDAPSLPELGEGVGPLAAAWADPWPGEVVVSAGLADDALSEAVRLDRPAGSVRRGAGGAVGPRKCAGCVLSGRRVCEPAGRSCPVGQQRRAAGDGDGVGMCAV
ncbi:hypothetical protein L53_02515 [Hyphomonas sp. L-53-1-40]|nr:hypothetical protein L53_02515 [Hyphomonas sp. L-53-1-40]